MKVRNLLGAYTILPNVICYLTRNSCKNIEKGKYPSVYIFLLKKEIKIKSPVTGLDFASLYTSLIMTYNLSLEKMILTNKEADNMQKNRNILHKIEFPFNKRILHIWYVRHNNQFEK